MPSHSCILVLLMCLSVSTRRETRDCGPTASGSARPSSPSMRPWNTLRKTLQPKKPTFQREWSSLSTTQSILLARSPPGTTTIERTAMEPFASGLFCQSTEIVVSDRLSWLCASLCWMRSTRASSWSASSETGWRWVCFWSLDFCQESSMRTINRCGPLCCPLLLVTSKFFASHSRNSLFFFSKFVVCLLFFHHVVFGCVLLELIRTLLLFRWVEEGEQARNKSMNVQYSYLNTIPPISNPFLLFKTQIHQQFISPIISPIITIQEESWLYPSFAGKHKK